MRFLILVALIVSSAASAQSYRRPLKRAVDALEDATNQARRGGPQCKQGVYSTLVGVTRQVDALKRDARPREVAKLKFEISNAASTAGWSRCPDSVMQNIQRAGEYLEEVRLAITPGNGPEEDTRWQTVQLGQLRVQPNGVFDEEPAVEVQVPELVFRRSIGKQYYFGTRFRSVQGHWTTWVTTPMREVTSDPFVSREALSHFIRYSSLAEENFGNGRFVVHVSVFDGEGEELAFREASFKVRLTPLPPGPAPVVVRDCGTGPDIGCTMSRDGQYPMDAMTFQGFIRSIEANSNEMFQTQTAQALFASNYVTAVQFGLILDHFRSDMFLIQVTQYAAPRLVNPQHALGYADKFKNSMSRAGYTQIIAREPTGALPGFQAPQPTNSSVPGVGRRDCGTGEDPGCTISRGQRWAMDAMTWTGFYASLQTTPNELTRAEMVRTLPGDSLLTAIQFGKLLSVFNNEWTRLDVAKRNASRVVNPMHTLALSTTFQNSLLAQEFVTVMGQQR